MKRFIIAALLGAVTLGVTPAAAQIGYRQDRQQARIERGVRTGQITPREASRLQRQQARIGRATYRAGRDGRLSYGERRRIQARQNRASRNIYRQRRDRQGYSRGYRGY